jgi:ElaB/YqjD/DUF883 family membrane-anchored ribosome-binding protein
MNGETAFYSQAAEWVVDTARRKPEALLLMAAGCALLMRGTGTAKASSRPGDVYGRPPWQEEGAGASARDAAYRSAEGATDYMGDVKDRLGETARDYTSTARDYARDYASAARDYAGDARRRMGEYTGAVRENLASAGGRVSRTAQSAASSAADTMREQPLLVAALGLVAGAAVAALFPTTDVERRTLGPAADALVGAAGAAGRDLVDRAARTGEEMKRAATERGLTPEGLADLAHEAAESFTRGEPSGEGRGTQTSPRSGQQGA